MSIPVGLQQVKVGERVRVTLQYGSDQPTRVAVGHVVPEGKHGALRVIAQGSGWRRGPVIAWGTGANGPLPVGALRSVEILPTFGFTSLDAEPVTDEVGELDVDVEHGPDLDLDGRGEYEPEPPDRDEPELDDGPYHYVAPGGGRDY